MALDEIREQRQAEQNSLNMPLEGLQSRAATAEHLLSEARQNLVMRTEEVRALDRKAVEATIARNNAEKRLAQAEGMHEMRENQVKDVEKARAALAERTNTTTKTLKAREAALVRAEERIAALTERNGHLAADVQVIRTSIEKRVEELNSALQRERMEHAMVAGALEATRKDNARLQSEVASLRSILRRGMALDELPVAPDEPANDEAIIKTRGARTRNRRDRVHAAASHLNVTSHSKARGFGSHVFLFAVRHGDNADRASYMRSMRTLLVLALFALLALSLWFAGAAWERFGGEPMPLYGYFAIAGGVLVSLLVGGGLMGLVFYSSRHGYHDINDRESQ